MNTSKEKVLSLWRSYNKESRQNNPSSSTIFDQALTHFLPNSYFYYVFDFIRFEMKIVSPQVQEILGVAPNSFNTEELLNRIHPTDIPIMQKSEEIVKEFFLSYLPKEDITKYKVVYSIRIKRNNGQYYHNLHQTTVLSTVNEKTIESVICTETDISHISKTPRSTISFIDLEGDESYLDIDINNPSFKKVNSKQHSLTTKELEVLKLISYGLTTEEIAKKLHISPNTVRTHRQNMLKKEKTSKMTALINNFLTRGII